MKKTLLTLGVLTAATLSSQAALSSWDFSAESGLTPDGSAAGTIMASTKNTVTAGITSSDLVGTGTVAYEDFNGALGELNLRNFNDGATPDGALEFTLTADFGTSFDVTGINLSAYRNGSGAASTWNFLTSVDGGAFTQFGDTKTPAAGGAPGFETFSFTGSIVGAESVVFRFEAINGSGNIHFNGLEVVPEPSTALLGALGMLALLRRRRA